MSTLCTNQSSKHLNHKRFSSSIQIAPIFIPAHCSNTQTLLNSLLHYVIKDYMKIDWMYILLPWILIFVLQICRNTWMNVDVLIEEQRTANVCSLSYNKSIRPLYVYKDVHAFFSLIAGVATWSIRYSLHVCSTKYEGND